MLLTKKSLRAILENMRTRISEDLERELLDTYGKLQLDDEGHIREFTDQDIYEQVRKIMIDKRCVNDDKIKAS